MHFARICKIPTSYAKLWTAVQFQLFHEGLKFPSCTLLGERKAKPLGSLVKSVNFLCLSVHVTSKDSAVWCLINLLWTCLKWVCPDSSDSKQKIITPKWSEYVWVWPKLANIFLKWHLQQRMKYSILIISLSITHFYAECCGEGMKREKKKNQAAQQFEGLSSSLRHRGCNLCITDATVIIWLTSCHQLNY